MPLAKCQRSMRLGQVFDDIQQDDDVEHSKLRKRGFIGGSADDGQPTRLTERDGSVGDFNSSHIIEAAGFFQKETIGAADFQKASAPTQPANVVHRARKFAAQNRFAAFKGSREEFRS